MPRVFVNRRMAAAWPCPPCMVCTSPMKLGGRVHNGMKGGEAWQGECSAQGMDRGPERLAVKVEGNAACLEAETEIEACRASAHAHASQECVSRYPIVERYHPTTCPELCSAERQDIPRLRACLVPCRFLSRAVRHEAPLPVHARRPSSMSRRETCSDDGHAVCAKCAAPARSSQARQILRTVQEQSAEAEAHALKCRVGAKGRLVRGTVGSGGCCSGRGRPMPAPAPR